MDKKIINPPPVYPFAISVVIPMYNAEKYIGACLSTLLTQTFQNFEVIVVDDCSTDNSVAVVESFMPHFGGRLRISRMKKNSGGPGAPTNKGLIHAGGKYFFTMDNDDMLVNEALDGLYRFAEDFNADVVHMDRNFSFNQKGNEIFPKYEDIRMTRKNDKRVAAVPTLETQNIVERLTKFCNGDMAYAGWRNFVRRDLLVENEIFFPPEMKSAQDVVWTIKLLVFAKNFVRIPYPFYIYRVRNDSLSHTKSYDENGLKFWSTVCLNGLKYLDEFLSGQEFFRDNPHCRLQLLNYFERTHFGITAQTVLQLPPHEIYKNFLELFGDKFGTHGELIAYLLSSSNLSWLNFLLMNQRAAELERRQPNSSQ